MVKKESQVVEPYKLIQGTLEHTVKGFYDFFYIGMNLAFSDIQTNPENLEYSFSVCEVKRRFGLKDKDNSYRKLIRMAKYVYLKQPVVTIIVDGETIHYRIFDEIGYKNSSVRIQFHKRFKDALVEWYRERGMKVYFDLLEVLPMSSEYSKKLYPMLISDLRSMKFSGSGNCHGNEYTYIISVDSFREQLCIPSSYQTVHVKNLCDSCVDEINLYTAYTVQCDYNYVKGIGRGGHILTHLCFFVKRKSVDENDFMRIQKEIAGIERGKDDDILWYHTLTGLPEASVKTILKSSEKYGRDRQFLTDAYQYACLQKPESMAAYLTSLMKTGFDLTAISGQKRHAKKKSVNRFTAAEPKADERERKSALLDAEFDELRKALFGFDDETELDKSHPGWRDELIKNIRKKHSDEEPTQATLDFDESGNITGMHQEPVEPYTLKY